uniref:SFRICE_038385 n=1 Tax=Spodoptera frugiperda TaxID=7108 RepID=A0A2H1VU52_SPOFR
MPKTWLSSPEKLNQKINNPIFYACLMTSLNNPKQRFVDHNSCFVRKSNAIAGCPITPIKENR